MEEKRAVLVLIGSVGSGKTVLASRLTQSKSKEDNSIGLCGGLENDSFVIYDTPPYYSTLEQDRSIMELLKRTYFSMVVLCVESHVRMDKVLDCASQMVDHWMDYKDHICIMVTKMDEVTWEDKEFKQILYENVGMERVFFSGEGRDYKKLGEDILGVCGGKVTATINYENEGKYFIVRDVKEFRLKNFINEEVNRIKRIIQAFLEVYEQYPIDERKYLILEFLCFIKQEKVKSLQRIHQNNLDLRIEEALLEGFLVDSSNKMNCIIKNIYQLSEPFHQDKAALYQCPLCGNVFRPSKGDLRCQDNDLDVPKGRRFSFRMEEDKLYCTNNTEKFRKSCNECFLWQYLIPLSIEDNNRMDKGQELEEIGDPQTKQAMKKFQKGDTFIGNWNTKYFTNLLLLPASAILIWFFLKFISELLKWNDPHQ